MRVRRLALSAATLLLACAAGCSSGAAPGVGSGASMTTPPAESPPPSTATAAGASGECGDLASAWSAYQGAYAAAGPNDYHGREAATLDFGKIVNQQDRTDPRAHQLDIDVSALSAALLRAQAAYLGIGASPTASTAPLVASAVAAVATDYQSLAAACVATPASSGSDETGGFPSPSDLPQFDRPAIGGTACAMTYGPSQSGGTVTTFTLNKPGELITHVSGPGGSLYRHDEQEPEGLTFFSYNVPLSQVTDMGASLYLNDGSTQTCSIGPTQ